MYDLKELIEYLYIEEYEDGFLFYRTFDDKVAEMIMNKINYKAYYLLRDCENLCEEDNEFYKNLILECFELVDDLENFNGIDDHFYELLDNLRNKIEEIMKLLSSNDDDDFRNELSDKLYDIYSLCDFY